MTIASATAMANRRRRTGLSVARLRKAPQIDEGTPETRARLQPPPWAGWPSELQTAAIELDVAVRLRAEHMRAKAQGIGRIGGEAKPDLSPHEAYCYRRYVGWLRLMEATGWLRHVPAVTACVVDHEPMADQWQLRAALMLWATGRVLRAVG